MTYHLIGMGGIGMSALARILIQKGEKVRGSDIQNSRLLEDLQKEGAQVQIGHSAESLQQGDIVVYSSGIDAANVEMKKAKSLKLTMLHRSDLLNQLMQNQQALLVTGTHGKTTTTALLSSVLVEAQLDPSFVIGGILRSMNTNAIMGKGKYFVAEADESDGSFLKTASDGAIVTNIEKEHLEFWKTEEKLIEGFQRFFKNVKNPSHLFWCKDDPILNLLNPIGFSYGFSQEADCRLAHFIQNENGVQFDLSVQNRVYPEISVSLFGRHNALNAAAVFALALSLKIDEKAIRKALKNFEGASRRLELIGSVQNIDVFDDYGHHPTEIACTLKGLRDRIRERRMVVIFQPHRYTRVRDLFHEFQNCFQEADELIVTDIYSASEPTIENISGEALVSKLKEKFGSRVHFFHRKGLEESVISLLRVHDTVLTIGAGDITHVGKMLLERLKKNPPQLTVGVLFGGTSQEYDVSIRSARNIFNALDPSIYRTKVFGISKDGVWMLGPDAFSVLEKKKELGQNQPKISPEILQELSQCDVCVPVFHGPQGEDGMIQGMLDTLDIPYAGSDYRASAVCMHKAWTKHVAVIHNVPTAPYIECDIANWRQNREDLLKRITENFSYPLWVKPVHLGSSIGVSRVLDEKHLLAAIELAFQGDDVLIVEREIDGRQIEFAVLGNDWVRVAAPGEIVNHGEFYDYEKKYGSQAMKTKTPADLTPVQEKLGKELAARMYVACGCKGLSRIDFFLDREGHYWLNEINPFPGFTAISLYPKMWEASGMAQPELCHQLIILALQKHRRLLEIRGK